MIIRINQLDGAEAFLRSPQSLSHLSINVENVNLRGCKWTETFSNRICNVNNEIDNNV
jgi:hypothetical protein